MNQIVNFFGYLMIGHQVLRKNRQTGLFMKAKNKPNYSKMLRGVYLYDKKHNFSKITIYDCHLIYKIIDKKILCVVLVVFTVIIVAFQFMKNAFMILVR